MSVTDLPASSEDQTGKQDTSPAPEGGKRLGRRFILTGMPFAMTLANRPAFATGGGQCTMSLLASLTNSHPVRSDLNCGVSPGCWKQHALDCTNTWESLQAAGISTGQTFRSLFSMPAAWTLVSGTSTTAIEANLLQVLQNNYKFRYNGPGSNDFTTSNSGAPKHILAGLLNAVAFNGGLVVNGVHVMGHYPVTPSSIMTAVANLFALAYTSGDFNTFKSTVNTTVDNTMNLAYQVGPDSQHYCDVDL